MGIETDLNVSPYFDDANNAINDNYHRILFRPAVPVQARELTQLQDILQNQIERFGDNIFVSGTIIKGCNFSFDSSFYYTKILDLRPIDSQPVNPVQYVGLLAHEPVSNLYAICVDYKDGFESQDPDLNTLYFKYINSGVNNEQVFSPGSQLTFYTNTNIAYANSINQFSNGDVKVASVANAVGVGYSMSVSSGIVFQKGHFIQVANNTSTIVSKYTNVPDGVVVGFNIAENIVTELQDSNLLDHATGYTNLNAPGAHRLQLEPTLAAYPIGSVPTSNFLALVEWEGGNIVKSFQQTQYSSLGNELARRTYEESGNYYIKPFHLHMENGNATHNYAVTSAGLAYIEGHRVEQLNNIRVPVRKGTDLKTVSNQILTTNYNNSILVQEYAGNFPCNIGATISIRSAAATYVTSDSFGAISAPGSEIGTAKILSVQYESGVVGTPTAQYRIYLADIRMNSGKNFRDAKAFYYGGSPAGVADVFLTFDSVLSANIAVLSEPSKSCLVFKTSKSGLHGLASTGSLPNYVYRTVNNAITINGTTGNSNLLELTGSNYFPYSQGILTAVQEPEVVVIPTAFSSGANFANVTLTTTGNVQVTSGSANVIPTSGNTTAFAIEYQVGDYICIANTAKRIVNISNNTLLTVDSTYSSSNTGTHHKTYPVNVPINFTNRNSYITITDSVSQHMQLSLASAANTAETLSANMTVSIYTNVLVPNDTDRSLQANTSIAIRLNLANNAGGVNGPWCLGVPYAYNLKHVYRSSNTGTFVSATQSGNTYMLANTTGFSNGFAISGNGIVPGTTANVANSTAFVLSAAASSTVANGQYTYGYYSNAAVDDISYIFTLQDGQKDAFFDQSFLVKNPVYKNVGLSSSDLLTVVFDAYKPQNTGKGYISIDSYDTIIHTSGAIGYENIPSFTDSAGNYYELRDSIDFRPFVQNTAAYSTAYTSSVINPVYSSALPTSENYIVSPNKTFIYSADYYVGRIDKLMINSYGAYSVVEGLATEIPVTPADKSGSMTLASISIPPYPSLSSTVYQTKTAQNSVISVEETKLNRSYTMKDIAKLDQRVFNLEYYTSLNLLEQKTNSLTIASDITGANRFKNGIFVDNFSTSDSLEVNSPEFRAALSPSETAIVPRTALTKIELRYDSGTNTAQNGDFVTISEGATLVPFIQQKYASDAKQCTDTFYNYVGSIKLHPSYDDVPDIITVTQTPVVITTPPTVPVTTPVVPDPAPAPPPVVTPVNPPVVTPVPPPPPPKYTNGQLKLTVKDESYNTVFDGYTGTGNIPSGFLQIYRNDVASVAAMLNSILNTNFTTWKPLFTDRRASSFHMTQSGYFIPPVTGNYIFTCAHDDDWSLRVGSGYYYQNSWDNNSPSVTTSIYLTAGQYYNFTYTLYANVVGNTAGTLSFTVDGVYYYPTDSMFARDNTPSVSGTAAPTTLSTTLDLYTDSLVSSIPGFDFSNLLNIPTTSVTAPVPAIVSPTTVTPIISDSGTTLQVAADGQLGIGGKNRENGYGFQLD